VPGRATYVTHPSPLGVPSHQADVQILEATASRSCTLPRVHTVLDIAATEHPLMSAGQELSGHCLVTTSSQAHTSVCSTKQLFIRRVTHSPYMSTGQECLDAVCSRKHLSTISVCMRRGPNKPLNGLEQGREDAAAWDSDDDEFVSFVVQELEDIIFDDEYARQHGGSAVGRQPNIYKEFDANLARIAGSILALQRHRRCTQSLILSGDTLLCGRSFTDYFRS
jgi:hypothetical protein